MKCVSYTRTIPWKNHKGELTIADQNQRIAEYLAEHKELNLQKRYSDRKNAENAGAAFDKMIDDVAGAVDSEEYQQIREEYSRQYDDLRTALQKAEAKKMKVEQQIREYLNMTSNLEEHLDDFGFDAQLVKSLVQRIEVSADKRIRIVFGFQDVFADLGKAHINHRQHPGGFEGASAAYAGLFLFSDFNTDGC